ncbi:hypothetical protein [Aurantimonas phage AmM-1]|uniref:hypothetical protein n=1 Tax=Aurantimonas phage AmM-1 TaxID=1503929 RepID=UPI0005408FB7|nr:hypothetical protein ACQ23_gp09 [Aurantimonas phage AmM-1]BAP94466.1 hypothetical protein [Aurantimonas phage AmM-1]
MPILTTLAETMSAAIADDAFGERVLLAPMKKGERDPDRAAREVIAVLRTGGGGESNLSGGMGQSWRVQLAAGKAEAHIDLAAYPDLHVRVGDALRALERRGQPWFEVARPDDRGAPRLVLELSEK